MSELISLRFHPSKPPSTSSHSNGSDSEDEPQAKKPKIVGERIKQLRKTGLSRLIGPDFVSTREYGFYSRRSPINRNIPISKGTSNFHRQLYSNLTVTGKIDPNTESKLAQYGGAFGMDFNSTGSMLSVAYEQRSIAFFDASNHRLINAISEAHTDCCNSVKFLDDRLLASCSDDCSIKLWDLRNMKKGIKTLRGHSNWVKNVEYVADKGLLISSAFDGYVYGWDINEGQYEPKRLFYTPGLMRMRLSGGGDKMIISTQWGYLLVVHDVDLKELPKDLFGFKPNMYWLMMKCRQSFASSQDGMVRFTADRNRTEILADFPDSCDPENISSICPHPEGWAIASRSNNHDEQSEWTCVHDIQCPPVKGSPPPSLTPSNHPTHQHPPRLLLAEEDEAGEPEPTHSDYTASVTATIMDSVSSSLNQSSILQNVPNRRRSGGEGSGTRRRPENIITLNILERDGEGGSGGTNNQLDISDSSSEEEESEEEEEYENENEMPRWLTESRWRRRRRYSDEGSSGRYTFERTEERRRISGGRRGQRRRRRLRAELNVQNQESEANIQVNSSLREPRAFFIRTGPPNSGNRTIVVLGSSSPPFVQEPPENEEIGGRAQTLPPSYSRLLYHCEEPRLGRGFIKEQSWSPEGRILASPFGHGLRLLAFNPDCDELPSVVPFNKAPSYSPLTEIGTKITHDSVVLCAEFCKSYPLLVCGSLKGGVTFLHPQF